MSVRSNEDTDQKGLLTLQNNYLENPWRRTRPHQRDCLAGSAEPVGRGVGGSGVASQQWEWGRSHRIEDPPLPYLGAIDWK